MLYRNYLLVCAFVFIACNTKKPASAPASTGATCSCQLSKEEMIAECPVDAVDDSVVICKVGTIYVAGSDEGAMTWLEYFQSKYKGGRWTCF